jgi:hypothetical protein
VKRYEQYLPLYERPRDFHIKETLVQVATLLTTNEGKIIALEQVKTINHGHGREYVNMASHIIIEAYLLP